MSFASPKHRRNIPLAILVALACFGFSSTSFAQAPSQNGEPVGFDIVKRCAEESGGLAAFTALRSIMMKGSIVVTPQLPVSDATTVRVAKPTVLAEGTIEVYYRAPDLAKVIVDLGEFGRSERCVYHGDAWESSVAGVRKLEPLERARLIDSISLRETFEPTKVFTSFTNRGGEKVEGDLCYRVEVTRAGSIEADQIFFSAESGLPRRTIAMRDTLGGKRVIDSTIQEYQTFENVKIATRIRQRMEAFKMVHDVNLHTVEVNKPIEDSFFSPPAELHQVKQH